jgi:cytochrome bd-type quinol oxidase subunit 2
MSGFYWAGFLCLVLAALKLRMEGQWSWWRVLLPLWVVLGHNALYVVVGFAWLSFADDGEAGEEATIRESNSSYAYQVAALICFVIFADNLLGRIEGTENITWMGLRSGWWALIVASGVLSALCQLLFWSSVFPPRNCRNWEEERLPYFSDSPT